MVSSGSSVEIHPSRFATLVTVSAFCVALVFGGVGVFVVGVVLSVGVF